MPIHKMEIDNKDTKRWYILRANFNRALMAQTLLTKQGVENFVPLEKREVIVKGKKPVTKLMPVLLNLVFVKTTLSQLKEITALNNYLYYLTYRKEGVV